jgi:chloride channel protein, CIC family
LGSSKFRLQKYLRPPKLRTNEPFFRYLEKWLLVSVIVGFITGLVVAVFDYATNLTLWSYFPNFFSDHIFMIFPIVLVGLLASGWLLKSSSNQIGSGTEEVIRAYHEEDGKIDTSSWSFPKKMLAAVMTIGFGGSTGQEGPSVYAGGVIGSWVWSKLGSRKLTLDDRRILVLAGAAAGIGAVFKAPLTGIIFALEVPFKDDLAHDALIPSLVSSVVSYLTLIAIDGSAPLFRFPGIVSVSMTDIGGSAVLGVVCGLAALLFIFVYRNTPLLLDRISSKFYVKALLGAIVVASIGIVSVMTLHRPYPLGISYDLVSLALSPTTLLSALLMLFVMKLLATSFTLGSTGDGGVFVPQIVMGAALGGVFGHMFYPASVDLFVAVGMASFLAAGFKTPLAAVAFVAETTAGPGYLIPSLIAAAISYSVSGEASVSENQKLRDEVNISEVKDLTADQVMTRNIIAVPAEISVLDFVEEYLFKYQHKRFPVVDKNGLIGTISMDEVKSTEREKWFQVLVKDACKTDYRYAYPDDRLQKILDLMYTSNMGRIPIVERTDPRRIVGIVSKTDIINAVEKRRFGT